MIETSTSGSSSSAAAISSSKCLLAGTLPGACDSTTVIFRPAIGSSGHLLLDRPLGDFPRGRQMFYIIGRRHPGFHRPKIEQPSLAVAVGVDERRVGKHRLVELNDFARPRSIESRHRLRTFDLSDFLSI